jgi:hypothetical protein
VRCHRCYVECVAFQARVVSSCWGWLPSSGGWGGAGTRLSWQLYCLQKPVVIACLLLPVVKGGQGCAATEPAKKLPAGPSSG